VSKLLTEKEALNLLFKTGCSRNVIAHCKKVSEVAVEIARKLQKNNVKVDLELVKIGALLHDIGRAKTHTVHHAIVGAEIARKEGLPESIIRIIERHVGGGITAEEAKKLHWPVKDYIPETIEEKIVCYADKLVEGNRKVSVEVTLKELSRELGENHPAIERVKKLHYEISSLLRE